MTTDRLRPSNFRYRLAPCLNGGHAESNETECMKDKEIARALASVNLSSVLLCEADIHGVYSHVLSLRLDLQPLISLAFMHLVPEFYACPSFMNRVYCLVLKYLA